MTDAIRHRGPDDHGFFEAPNVHLGMRRLSILDIEGGSQPQVNASGTTIVFLNGEIYNFLELRKELTEGGHRFRTQSSDTELLVHLYDRYGIGFADRLIGMFAISLWDARKQELYLFRDRFGKKPIYYAYDPVEKTLKFSSEFNGLLLGQKKAT